MNAAPSRASAPAPVSVLVVEGSTVLRDRLLWLVAEVDGVSTAAGAATPEQGLGRIAAAPVDAILVDADVATGPALAELGALRRAAPDALLVVLASEPGPELRERCAAMGADECLSFSAELPRLDELLRLLVASRAGGLR